MKTETTSPAPRSETARATQQGNSKSAQPGDKATPADLFAQLLSAEERQVEPMVEAVEPEADATLTALALPLGGATEATTTAPTPADEEADPRAAFWALLQPEGALDSTLQPSPARENTFNPMTHKGIELGSTVSARGSNKASAGTGLGAKISETTLLQRQGLELIPTTPLAETAAPIAPKAWHMAHPGQPGSALTDAPTTGSAWGQAVAAAAGGMGQGSQGQTGSDASSQGGSSQGRVWLDQPASANATDAATGAETDFAMSLGEAMGDAYEALGTQISVWSAANTKRASMTVDLGQERALEVDVALNDGKAQVAFRTDDQQVRNNLQTQAETILADLLARAGIALDGLSVGAQHSGQGRGQGEQGQPATRVQLHIEPESATRPDGSLARRTGHGRAGLDVYA